MKLGILIGILLSCIILITTKSHLDGFPLLQTAQSIGSLAIAISAIVASALYAATLKRHKEEDARKTSEQYLEEAEKLLGRAYEIYTDGGDKLNPPRNDRLLWLTTARMILRYYNVKEKIEIKEHRIMLAEHEEYWRVLFHNIIKNNQLNFTFRYFQRSGTTYGGENIYRDSMAVIFDFVRWYDDKQDPLTNYDAISAFAKGAIPIDQNGAREFIEQYTEYNQKIETRKAELENDP